MPLAELKQELAVLADFKGQETVVYPAEVLEMLARFHWFDQQTNKVAAGRALRAWISQGRSGVPGPIEQQAIETFPVSTKVAAPEHPDEQTTS